MTAKFMRSITMAAKFRIASIHRRSIGVTVLVFDAHDAHTAARQRLSKLLIGLLT